IEAARPGPDRFNDLALGYAVATADFGIVRKGGNGWARVRERTPRRKGLSEDQRFADIGDILAFPQEVEIPVAVRRIAIEHGAGDPVVFHYDPLVDPARSIAHHDTLAPVAAGKVPCGKQVDARDFQLGGSNRAFVAIGRIS